MMNRLRARLMASYLVVLAVTLLVMGLLLVVLLRNQPVASEPIVARLNVLARSIAGREIATGLLLNATQERIEQALNRVASTGSVRVIAAHPDGTVIYDTLDRYAAGEVIALRITSPPDAQGLLQGNFIDGGEEWVFVGDRITRLQQDALLLFADVRPASSWREVLRLFGNSVVRPLVTAGTVGILAALLMAGLTTQGIVRGLFRLQRATREVAAGNLAERVPVSGPDEVQDVARAFNEMASQVEAAQAAQQDFLANVTHDLRTPLTSIQGFSQAIIDGTSKDPAYHAQIIHDEAGRLNRMVGELLDLARIAAGRLALRQGPVDVALVANGVAERLALKAREHDVHLVRDIRPAQEITGDGDRLAQVLTNLIDNAIKFTPAGGTVRVAVGPGEGGVQIVVSDTGQGIPREELPRVFERFYQVDKARGPQRGTGLGLAITAEIVHAHGGRIRADSGGPGTGTTITVWLPLVGTAA